MKPGRLATSLPGYSRSCRAYAELDLDKSSVTEAVPSIVGEQWLMRRGRTAGSRELGLGPESGAADLSLTSSRCDSDRAHTAIQPAATDTPTIYCFPDGRESAKSCIVCESCRAWLAAALLVATVVSGALLARTAAHTDPRLESLCQSDRERDRTGNPLCGQDRDSIWERQPMEAACALLRRFRSDRFHRSTTLACQRA